MRTYTIFLCVLLFSSFSKKVKIYEIEILVNGEKFNPEFESINKEDIITLKIKNPDPEVEFKISRINFKRWRFEALDSKYKSKWTRDSDDGQDQRDAYHPRFYNDNKSYSLTSSTGIPWPKFSEDGRYDFPVSPLVKDNTLRLEIQVKEIEMRIEGRVQKLTSKNFQYNQVYEFWYEK